MKLKPALKLLLLLGSLLMLAACATPAPKTQAPAPATDTETSPAEPGAYQRIAQDNPDVLTASQFAVGAQGQQDRQKLALHKVVVAEQQVVAGVNFRLCLDVDTGAGDKTALAVVYRNLSQEYSLSLWQWVDCP